MLRSQQPTRLRQFLLESARRFGDEDQVADVEEKSDDELIELMHRMIVARPDLNDLHRASRQWLFSHGIDSMGDDEPRRN